MKRGTNFCIVLITLFLTTLVVLRPCQGIAAGGNNWSRRSKPEAKRALESMCRVAREHCKREILSDDFDLPRLRAGQ
ncbi:hypothetical protein AWC38_SpisGene18769 [Stylophora pistillata]|uniref:Uncharacterized protein n=1 Tax=Stylophora pistillata TaxID=50429 RepID=A0A2B4RJD8_STYPI|nr:hypothetical protein AWC38_SpisGene18769 [Stylophora pistillata]